MTEDIRKLIAQRKNVKSKLTRFKHYLDKIDQDGNISQLQDRHNLFKDYIAEFELVQLDIELNNPDNEQHNIERETFEDLYFELLARSKALLPKQTTINSTNISQQNKLDGTQIKLPTIELPIFNGKYEDWLHFQELFKTLIDNNSSLSPIQKFHYLKSTLQGPALSIIDSLEVSSSNYETAWSLLANRFENKRVIVNNHVASICELKQIDKESGVALRSLLESLNKHIRALQTLSQPTEHWGTLLVYIVTKKLDYNTIKLWETQQVSNNVPKFEDLISFLEQRCNILESLEISRPNKGTHKSISQPTYRPQTKHNNKSTTTLVNSSQYCVICKNSHKIFQCDEFKNMNVSNRLQTVKQLGLCINCLSKGHLIKDCKSNNCKTCGRKHNTLLHFNSVNDKQESNNVTSSSSSTQAYPSLTTLASQTTQYQILLSTALVYIEDIQGNKHECRVLLDSASQSNLITERMVNKLNIPKENISVQLTGIGKKQSKLSHTVTCTIHSKHNAYMTTLNCLILPTITYNLPQIQIDTSMWKIPPSIQLADLHFNQPGPIDMLIGAELFFTLLCIGQIKPHITAPIFQKTRLGWVASGKIACNRTSQMSTCHISTDNSLHMQIRKFWEIENNEPTKYESTSEENYCETLYKNTTTRDLTGRYTVTLPVTNDIQHLGDSRAQANSRFLQLERNLSKSPHVYKSYSQFMDEYKKLGHMEEIDDKEETNFPTYYIPHLPVIREDSTTTKLRVVFDASAKTTTGLSLNDTLLVGPTIQQDVFTILARFRSHEFVLTADIEKMYRQIKINDEQADLQRILWRTNITEPIKTYKLLTVTYGTASAPFLAIRTLHQLAADEQENYPIGSEIVMKDFYVDDLMTGAPTLEQLRRIQCEVSNLLSSGGFIIRKWNSNCQDILQTIDVSLRALNDENTNKTSTKVLGMLWNSKLDNFEYTVEEQHPHNKISKRTILSELSSIFDPLGLLGPVIVKAKLFIQELWRCNINWDESLPQGMHSSWQIFRQQLLHLKDINVTRFAFMSMSIRNELHGFCDASLKAYGACIYVRSINSIGKISVNLLCSKSKVSPLKETTIPRLELCGALLLSELVNKIKDSGIQFDSYTLWTDSTVVLAWINTSPTNLKLFVSNRVTKIQKLNNGKCDWRHVRTNNNPADLISRGLNPKQIVKCDLWWHGPEWLRNEHDLWSKGTHKIEIIDLPEQKQLKTCLHTLAITPLIETSRFSKFSTLQRVTAFCLRFINNIRHPLNKRIGPLLADELIESTNYLLKSDQHTHLEEDYKRLLKGQQVKPTSKLYSLQPFIDEKGLIRVGGRLRHADIHYTKKHPIILPSKSHLTNLIVQYEHIRLLHAPPQLLLSSLRDKYWPLKGRDLCKKIVHACITCFKVNPKVFQPQMGDLPASRLHIERPFINTGTDMCGPVYIKSSRKRKSPIIKAYIALFVCMTTKAIHLELVSDLSTEAFLAAFKRFISRRGICSNIFSDNGTNYVGANRELKELRALFKSEEHKNKLIDTTSSLQIRWHFIPPRSPHFGGLWEAGIKSVKYHIRRVIGNSNLTFEEMYTTLTLIEACLNSRPINPISNDPTDLTPLTPGHFLIGSSLTTLPEPCLINIPINRLSMWQKTQQLAQHFWKRWSKEYLSFIQQRPKWKAHSPNLQLGQLVIVKEDNLPPLKWISGRVLEVHPGSDGVVRVATIKTSSGTLKQAVNKLCPLPVESSIMK